MVSTILIIGMIFAVLVTLSVPVVLLVYTLKKGGARNTPLTLLVSAACGMIVGYVPGIIGTLLVNIFGVSAESNVLYTVFFVLGFISHVIGLWFCVSYQKNLGLGLFKGMAVVSGQAIYVLLLSSSKLLNYLSMLNAAFNVNSYDTVEKFLADYPEKTVEDYNNMIKDWGGLSDVIPFEAAISDIALIAAIMLISFILVKKILDQKLIQGLLISFGISALAYLPSYYTYLIDQETVQSNDSLLLTLLIYNLVFGAACLFFSLRVAKKLPREPKQAGGINPAKKAREEAEARAGKRAWGEVNQLNKRNLRSITEIDTQSLKTPSQLKAELEEALSEEEDEAADYENASEASDYADEASEAEADYADDGAEADGTETEDAEAEEAYEAPVRPAKKMESTEDDA